MPCQQITNTGISYSPPLSSRSGPFATEADCLNACKEGACCNGTTCSVKPQCQCVCTTGSCCGPEIETINGITGPKCRDHTQITRDACIAAGGTWRCETLCNQWGGDLEFGVQPLPCTSLAGSAGPVFKGVGTVCSPNPCCECSDNAPLSVFATIQNMDQIDGFYGPGGAAALRSLLVGNTYEMTRPYLNPSTFACRPFFLYESSAASCGASACTNSVASIRLSLTPTGALPQNVAANVPISPNYVLLLEAWATNPCVFTYGRQGVSTGVFGTFSMRATELVCSGGSAVVEVWNACAPGIQNWFKNADILLEW